MSTIKAGSRHLPSLELQAETEQQANHRARSQRGAVKSWEGVTTVVTPSHDFTASAYDNNVSTRS